VVVVVVVVEVVVVVGLLLTFLLLKTMGVVELYMSLPVKEGSVVVLYRDLPLVDVEAEFLLSCGIVLMLRDCGWTILLEN
jgi:hypothetical protein